VTGRDSDPPKQTKKHRHPALRRGICCSYTVYLLGDSASGCGMRMLFLGSFFLTSKAPDAGSPARIPFIYLGIAARSPECGMFLLNGNVFFMWGRFECTSPTLSPRARDSRGRDPAPGSASAGDAGPEVPPDGGSRGRNPRIARSRPRARGPQIKLKGERSILNKIIIKNRYGLTVISFFYF
jgi:hypothetical protein